MSEIGQALTRLRPGYADLAHRLIAALAGDARVQCVLDRVAAEALLPRARKLPDHQQVPWPAAFAAATHRHLQQTST